MNWLSKRKVCLTLVVKSIETLLYCGYNSAISVRVQGVLNSTKLVLSMPLAPQWFPALPPRITDDDCGSI